MHQGTAPMRPFLGHQSPARACAFWLLSLAVLASLGGCARATVAPPLPAVPAIVLLPVDNRTGSELYADAAPLIGLLRESPALPRATAVSLLTDEIERALVTRGFQVIPLPAADVAAPGWDIRQVARHLETSGIDAPALFVQLWRWEPTSASHVLFVDVKLDATLVARDGQVLWTSRLSTLPIDGGGAGSVALAYPAVARRVVAATLDEISP